jgi:site-specific DNA-methyltransferase (adenine-specific)
MSLPVPYFQDESCTIYHGDCRELLPLIEPVDLVLTDPPYGLGELWQGGGGSAKSSWKFHPSEAQAWDHKMDDADIIYASLCGHAAIVWGGNNYMLPPSRCWFIWDKKMNDDWSTGQAELAWTNLDRTNRVFRMAQGEAHARMRQKDHPTQKPIELMRWCIQMAHTIDPQTILDPFMGSGTTLRAAKDLGRKAIGIEIEERYCEIAARRLSQSVLPLEIPA